MKGLYFWAAVARRGDAAAIMHQTGRTLRPFDHFLGQAIHTAKQRQVRYRLPWEPVEGLQEIELRPLDHRVFVPRGEPSWLINGWPDAVEPDTGRSLMVVNRDVGVEVAEWRRTAGGLRIRPVGELYEDDDVFWCGHHCALVRQPEPHPPGRIEAENGAPLRLIRPPEPAEGGWALVLEGWNGAGKLLVDGERVVPEVLSAKAGVRRLHDAEGRTLDLTDGTLKVERPPADGPLTGDNGVRFSWRRKPSGKRGDRGHQGGVWVQLLPPENEDSEEFLDPRAAFCEGEVDEVWTRERHSRDSAFAVRKVDAERYQLLLDRLPPKGSSLLLPVDVRNLQRQKRALRQLSETPLPHHQGLLRLCENPERVRWPSVREQWPEHWYELTDETRSGTAEQREFVAKALGTPDLALLEGPPGSGKTTAICELIQQLAAQGKRVLLCSSTHVAIDNVLERLLEAGAPVDPVRIGRAERVDEKVRAVQIDQKVDALLAAWRAEPRLAGHEEEALRAMAERTVIMAADLTCGTTMGITGHPVFREGDRDRQARGARPIATRPHWDFLIMDEASKALTQEFLVPALMAARWTVVGDVRQLPPFTDRAGIVANLRSLVDEKEREVFPADHQRACLIRFRLAGAARSAGARWLIVEPPAVLDRLAEELRDAPDAPSAVRVVARTGTRRGPLPEVGVAQLADGDTAALLLSACDWVLVGEDLLPEVARCLPADLLHYRDPTRREIGLAESDALLFRHRWWLGRAGRLARPYGDRRRADVTTFEQAEEHERRWFAEHDVASEIAWRLTRLHELRYGRDARDRARLDRDLRGLYPVAVDISEPIAETQDIGLPSVLEVVQVGIGAERTARPSALTEGMPRRQPHAFRSRFVGLSYQHRMHPDISTFPRDLFYGGVSLRDANTIAARDQGFNWDFVPFRERRAWVDVRGREAGGENAAEIDEMEHIVREFLAWARAAGPPRRGSPCRWEVACLCFYVKQEKAISRMLQRVTGDDRRTRFTAGDVELACGTVDRFQGREADLVLLSMRNTRRVGFLDSPNRLNVALTRARQQLLIIGNAGYFADCRITELQELARRSPLHRGRRHSRREGR